jgi:glycosyltransferase involved in cell wall biosynthesis
MKVLHLIHNYYPSSGGAQLVFQKLSEGFVNRYRDDVTVLTTNAMRSPSARDNELVPAGDEVVNGVLVRRFPFWTKPLPTLRRAIMLARRAHLPVVEYLDPLRTGPLSPTMALAARRTKADVIACIGFPFMQMFYALAGSAPVILFGALHLHGDELPAPIRRAIRRADAYVAFTQVEADVVVKNGLARDRVHVVGLGADIEKFAFADGAAMRARLGFDAGPVVGFIGRQARYKGVDVLVEAMPRVWERHPDAQVLIAGSRTEFGPELDRMLAELPPELRARVVVIDNFTDDEKPQLFAACNVFVTISTDESFGIVFVEAWACGKPVVGGRIPAVECVIRDGVDGFLVPCKDPPALVTALDRLLSDPALRARMGEAGHLKARAENDWSVVVDRCHEIYARVSS